MNIENLKELITNLKNKKDFDWSKEHKCIASLVPEKSSNKYFSGRTLLEKYLKISPKEASMIFLADYRYNGVLICWEELEKLNKKAALRLLNKCLKLKRVPTINEFKFISSDFNK